MSDEPPKPNTLGPTVVTPDTPGKTKPPEGSADGREPPTDPNEDAALWRITNRFMKSGYALAVWTLMATTIVLAVVGTIRIGEHEVDLDKQLSQQFETAVAQLRGTAADETKQLETFTSQFEIILKNTSVSNVVAKIEEEVNSKTGPIQGKINSANETADNLTTEAGELTKKLKSVNDKITSYSSLIDDIDNKPKKIAELAKLISDYKDLDRKFGQLDIEFHKTQDPKPAPNTGPTGAVAQLIKDVSELQDKVRNLQKVGPPQPPQKQDERPLTKEEWFEAQELLNWGNYRQGKCDGLSGTQTQKAVISFQNTRLNIAAPDGILNRPLIVKMREFIGVGSPRCLCMKTDGAYCPYANDNTILRPSAKPASRRRTTAVTAAGTSGHGVAEPIVNSVKGQGNTPR